MLYSPCPQTPLYEWFMKEDRLLDVPYKFYDGFHALFKHPHFSTERLESILNRLIKREYEELGPSIFRILEAQLNGYMSLKDSSKLLFRARSEYHKKLCFEIYPLLKQGIKRSPSQKVQKYPSNFQTA